ncbi:DEAD/DEAH box helicase [Nocardioides sp. GY 10127]|uniref:DEAD/DEAH box helicase n=1 Tax=Nocardioides sp. GY 10127 TaxID=2569762 RepID=UPI001458DF13|nr:DEAD/DEAH box helicase [Nocardioides sp. GY 10127]
MPSQKPQNRLSGANTTLDNLPFTRSAQGPQNALQAHQRDGVLWLTKQGNERALLADEVGLGKTATLIVSIQLLLDSEELPFAGRHPLSRVLWVTDVSLIDQTLDEFGLFAPGMVVMTATAKEIASSRWQQEMRRLGPADVLIVGYESATARQAWLGTHDFSMLVLDEIGKLRGGGKTWEAIRGFQTVATRRVVGVTATPLENEPRELHRILAAIGTPGLWNTREFEDLVEWEQFVDPRTGAVSRRPLGWLNDSAAAEVRAFLSGCMLRRTAEEVGLPLPQNATAEPVEWVPLNEEQRAAYDAARRLAQPAATFHARQKAGLTAPESSAVLDRLVEILQEKNRPAIVFSEYLDLLDRIEQRLTGAGITWATVSGEAKDAARASALERFRTGEAQVLIGNVVLERGLNLQHCNLLISVGSSWNPAREAQREGRIRRLGSAHKTYEHVTLMPATSLHGAQSAVLQRKRAIAVNVGLS